MSWWIQGAGLAISAFSAFSGDDGGQTTSSTSTTTTDETRTTRLDISQEAVDKTIADVLGSTTGLADIFSKEKVAGLYEGTVAAQASGDLVANLVGEIAKLRATTIETTEGTVVKEGDIDVTEELGTGEKIDLTKDIYGIVSNI